MLQNKTFFLLGAVIFSIIATANLFNFIFYIYPKNAFMIVSNFAGIFFNYVVAYMFFSWRKQEVKPLTDYIEPDNMNELIKEAKNGK